MKFPKFLNESIQCVFLSTLLDKKCYNFTPKEIIGKEKKGEKKWFKKSIN